MQLYKVEAENVQLVKQVKQLSDQYSELTGRFTTETARLQEGEIYTSWKKVCKTNVTIGKQEIAARLTAQKDDLRLQLDLLQQNTKNIIREKDERISFLDQQAKVTYLLLHEHHLIHYTF